MRFRVREIDKCVCGMRLFEVDDLREGDIIRAHVGRLNPHDKAHEDVRDHLRAEQAPKEKR